MCIYNNSYTYMQVKFLCSVYNNDNNNDHNKHDKVGKVIHRELCKKLKFDHMKK